MRELRVAAEKEADKCLIECANSTRGIIANNLSSGLTTAHSILNDYDEGHLSFNYKANLEHRPLHEKNR